MKAIGNRYILTCRPQKKSSLYLRRPHSTQQPIVLNWEEPDSGKQLICPAAKGKSQKKWLLIASVTLFFAAGMCYRFFISNRRDFYATDGNLPRHRPPRRSQTALPQISRQHPEVVSGSTGEKIIKPLNPSITKEEEMRAADQKRSRKSILRRKRILYSTVAIAVPIVNSSDSLRKSREAATIALVQKIKAHPEDYLLISTGNYKTGVLGGISEVSGQHYQPFRSRYGSGGSGSGLYSTQ